MVMAVCGTRVFKGLILAGTLLIASSAAQAHPHVWVSGRSALVFGTDRAVAAVKHSWTFDELFSTMATQGLDADGDGKLSKAELDPLAQVNVESLAEYGYFTFLGTGKDAVEFADPVDYWIDYANGQLTLHFTLPVKTALPENTRASELAVYDPSYFVAFSFAASDALRVENKPDQCSAALKRNETPSDAPERFVPDDVIAQLGDQALFGETFAERVEITCQ